MSRVNSDTIALLDDWMLIKPYKPPTKKGAILLPEQAKRQETMGLVLAVGPGAPDPNAEPRTIEYTAGGNKRTLMDQRRRRMMVRPGDSVVFSTYAGEKLLVVEDEMYVVLQEPQVIGIIDQSLVPEQEDINTD